VALDCEADVVATTDELPVHLPLTIAALEPEGASDARRVGSCREPVEVDGLIGRNRRRIDAVVGHGRAIDDDPEDLRSLTGAQHISSRATTVVLFETILEMEGLSGLSSEVDDDVDAFRNCKPRTCYLHRLLQQVAVGRDLPERLGRVVWSKHEHLVEARRSGVQPAEAIAPRTYVQHRLYLAVDEELVSENSVCIKQIER